MAIPIYKSPREKSAGVTANDFPGLWSSLRDAIYLSHLPTATWSNGATSAVAISLLGHADPLR